MDRPRQSVPHHGEGAERRIDVCLPARTSKDGKGGGPSFYSTQALALQLRFFRGQGRRCGDLPKVAVELPRSPDLLTVAAAQNARERQSQSTNEINATVVLGYLRVMFAVDDIDETLERLRN